MKFRAKIQQRGKTATGFEVPEKVVTALGAGKRPLVRVTINGKTYRSAVAVMGGTFMVGVSAENRALTGVAGGDTVDIDLELDTAPRDVPVPKDFAAALKKDAKARSFFETLTASQKNRHVSLIEGAKTAETRERRIAKAIDDLRAGKK
jgi:hypothetical protein